MATLYNIGVHGTLIHSQWVVTAAHAIFCMQQGSFIKVGDQLVEVEARYTHPEYKLDGKSDIALLKLKQPIEGIQPADTYKKTDEKGQIIWFIGVGGTGTGITGQTIDTQENKGVLRKAQNKVIKTKDSDIVFKFEKGDNAELLEGVSGNGDSGGPAYINHNGQYQLLGISSRTDSWFKDIGEYGITEFYTRLSSFNHWIETIINSNESQRLSLSTQNRFLQDNMKDNISKICNHIGLTNPSTKNNKE